MAAPDRVLVSDLFVRTEHPITLRALSVVLRFARTKPLGAFGALILVVVVLVGVFSPWLVGDPNAATLSDALTGPSASHWFGTDHNGRDVFARLVFGCQVTAMVGIGTVILVTALSLLVGVTSGYFGGRFDFFIQRLVDVWLSFPAIFLILTLVAVLKTTSSDGFFGLGHFGSNVAQHFQAFAHGDKLGGGVIAVGGKVRQFLGRQFRAELCARQRHDGRGVGLGPQLDLAFQPGLKVQHISVNLLGQFR